MHIIYTYAKFMLTLFKYNQYYCKNEKKNKLKKRSKLLVN